PARNGNVNEDAMVFRREPTRASWRIRVTNRDRPDPYRETRTDRVFEDAASSGSAAFSATECGPPSPNYRLSGACPGEIDTALLFEVAAGRRAALPNVLAKVCGKRLTARDASGLADIRFAVERRRAVR